MAVSVGHSAATAEEARAGYAAGATSTTHLFNAMSGVDHRAPGVAVAALLDDAAYVELIADGLHVHRALWPLITRLKPAGPAAARQRRARRSRAPATAVAGSAASRSRSSASASRSPGPRPSPDRSSRSTSRSGNLVASGSPLPAAVAAASRNPLALLGITDRGRIAVGQRADLVELDADLASAASCAAGPGSPAATP